MAKQHYVPNFILRNFAGPDGALWVFDKQARRCWRKNGPRYDAFAENEYLPNNVDDVFAPRETAAGPAIESIILSARTAVAPNLDAADREHLCRFLLAQILRVPRLRGYGEKKRIRRSIYHSLLRDDLRGDEDLAHPERGVFRAMLAMWPEVACARPGVQTPLLVNDEPCLWVGDLSQPGARIVMRLAKDVCVQLSHPADFAGGLHGLGADDVAFLNAEAFRKAARFVAGPTRDALGTAAS